MTFKQGDIIVHKKSKNAYVFLVLKAGPFRFEILTLRHFYKECVGEKFSFYSYDLKSYSLLQDTKL